MTAAEAAVILGVTPRAVAKAIRCGRLNAKKLPGKTGAYLLDPEEVRKFGELRAEQASA